MKCRACEASNLQDWYRVDGMPIHGVLVMKDQAEARGLTRDALDLVLCAECGFIQNRSFQPQLMRYASDYEETQAFSARFQEFMRGLARDLDQRHRLREKQVLEIGCGKGDFLTLLCQVTGCRGVGLDPAHVDGRLSAPGAGEVQFMTDRYEPHAAELTPQADLVVCRHTLEHIPNGLEFLRLIRRSMKESATLLVEVPDLERILHEGAFWDLNYEHCSNFTAGALARLLRRAGFIVRDLRRVYGDQYLLLEAQPGGTEGLGRKHEIEESVAQLRKRAGRFLSLVDQVQQHWDTYFERQRKHNRRTAFWGAGSRTISFFTAMDVNDGVECIVDINPHKQGTFLPGTGHPIVAPEALTKLQLDTIIVMNPIYVEEIRNELRRLDRCPTVLSL